MKRIKAHKCQLISGFLDSRAERNSSIFYVKFLENLKDQKVILKLSDL